MWSPEELNTAVPLGQALVAGLFVVVVAVLTWKITPIVRNTTYEYLREISPLLGSRTNLNTADNSMADVATRLTDLIVH